MIARALMLLALTALAFGGGAMARETSMPGSLSCKIGATCCPDNGGMAQTDCMTCCAIAPVAPNMPAISAIEPVAVHAMAPAILVQREVRPLDPPPRPLGQTEQSI